MKDDDYRFEENDDPRTWDDELVSDIESKEAKDETIDLAVLSYVGEFKALIDACGSVSYYWNMKKFVKAKINKAKAIASALIMIFGITRIRKMSGS